MNNFVRIGSALFNADHSQFANEIRRVEEAGVDFLHFDVFDGHFVSDLAFPPRTIQSLRPLTALPFEVHLAANDPLRFLPALVKAGVDLVFLPAESTPLLYEAIFSVREAGLKVGLCLALGTTLHVLDSVLPMLDAVLLLGRVTGEGQRGRTFNDLLLPRIRAVRTMIDSGSYAVDLQAAGGLETRDCRAAVAAGATSLPIGSALHRERDMAAYVAFLRSMPGEQPMAQQQDVIEPARKVPSSSTHRVLIASRSFGPNCPEALERMKAAGCEFIPNPFGRAPTEDELLRLIGDIDVLISGTEPVTAKVLQAAPRLKVIAKHGVGYDNIDLAAAKARNIPVALTGGAIADSVADMAMALLLALARQIPQGDSSVRRGEWQRMVGIELRGKMLGIVGLGQIGKELCRRAKGFGLQIVAYDVYHDEPFALSPTRRTAGYRGLHLIARACDS
jgi:ribulose-phosphate 3-epimerase